MTRWIAVDNPAWSDEEPRIVKATCHDRSNILTIRCPWCRDDGHIHESQTVGVDREALAEVRCHMCGNVSDVVIGDLHDAFTKMRADGWIE